MHLHLVWLKKDLRLSDHAPLHLAAEAARSTGGVLVLLYCLEPRLIKQPDCAPQHFEFTRECLQELAAALPDHVPLFLAKANMPVALQSLLMSGVEQLSVYSHEETGNWASFERDKEVMRWCKAKGVDWQEFPSNAVVRRLKNRDEWGKLWLETMRKPVLPVPDFTQLPQALRVVIPPIGNDTISMLKFTSLVSVLALPDLLYSAQMVYARTYQTVPLLIVATIWYLVLTTILTLAEHSIEHRLKSEIPIRKSGSRWLSFRLFARQQETLP